MLGWETTTALFSLFSLSDLPLHLTTTLMLASLLLLLGDSKGAFRLGALGETVSARDREDMDGAGELMMLELCRDEPRTGGRIEPWAAVLRRGPGGSREEPFMICGEVWSD